MTDRTRALLAFAGVLYVGSAIGRAGHIGALTRRVDELEVNMLEILDGEMVRHFEIHTDSGPPADAYPRHRFNPDGTISIHVPDVGWTTPGIDPDDPAVVASGDEAHERHQWVYDALEADKRRQDDANGL